MKKIIAFLLTIIIVCLIVLHKQNQYEDNGLWVKLSENIPEGGYLLHDNHIYGCYLDSLSDIDKISPLDGVDVSSFEVCKGTDYARDKNRVYYPIHAVAVDGEDFGYTVFKEYVLKKEHLYGMISVDVNPKSFIYIGEGYAVDGNNMFRYGQKIKWDSHIFDRQH